MGPQPAPRLGRCFPVTFSSLSLQLALQAPSSPKCGRLRTCVAASVLSTRLSPDALLGVTKPPSNGPYPGLQAGNPELILDTSLGEALWVYPRTPLPSPTLSPSGPATFTPHCQCPAVSCTLWSFSRVGSVCRTQTWTDWSPSGLPVLPRWRQCSGHGLQGPGV